MQLKYLKTILEAQVKLKLNKNNTPNYIILYNIQGSYKPNNRINVVTK